MELRRRGTWTWRRGAICLLIAVCLGVLIVVLPAWTGVSVWPVFVVAWAILLLLLIWLPKRA
jgi:hypothetical protein